MKLRLQTKYVSHCAPNNKPKMHLKSLRNRDEYFRTPQRQRTRVPTAHTAGVGGETHLFNTCPCALSKILVLLWGLRCRGAHPTHWDRGQLRGDSPAKVFCEVAPREEPVPGWQGVFLLIESVTVLGPFAVTVHGQELGLKTTHFASAGLLDARCLRWVSLQGGAVFFTSWRCQPQLLSFHALQ